MIRAAGLLLVAATVLLAAGCGQKRDLVLPDPPPAPASPPAAGEPLEGPPASAH